MNQNTPRFSIYSTASDQLHRADTLEQLLRRISDETLAEGLRTDKPPRDIQGDIKDSATGWRALITLYPLDSEANARHMIHPNLDLHKTAEMNAFSDVPNKLEKATHRFCGSWQGRHWIAFEGGRLRRGSRQLWDFYRRRLRKDSEAWCRILIERNDAAGEMLQHAANVLSGLGWNADHTPPTDTFHAGYGSVPDPLTLMNAGTPEDLAAELMPFVRRFDPTRPLGPAAPKDRQ